MNKPTVLDVFCGAGGFSEGFRQQGFEIKMGIDRWRPAIETFNHNFGVNSVVNDIVLFQRSIKAIESLPDTEVILGSPPCVTFSNSNASGNADKKSGLLLTRIFLRVVAIKKFKTGSKLKAWYMENVANSKKFLPSTYTFRDLGLTRWAKQNSLDPKDVAITLKDHQHNINSADYGAAQSRNRLISGEIIKREVGKVEVGEFPSPPQTNTGPVSRSGLPPHRTIRDILSKFPKPNEVFSRPLINDPQYNDIAIPAEDISDHFYDTGLYTCEWSECRYLKVNHAFMGRMSFPENIEKPSRTVMATRFGISREAMVYESEYNRVGDGEYRTPTVREAACLMGVS